MAIPAARVRQERRRVSRQDFFPISLGHFVDDWKCHLPFRIADFEGKVRPEHHPVRADKLNQEPEGFSAGDQ